MGILTYFTSSSCSRQENAGFCPGHFPVELVPNPSSFVIITCLEKIPFLPSTDGYEWVQ